MKGKRLARPLRIHPLDALGGYLCRYPPRCGYGNVTVNEREKNR